MTISPISAPKLASFLPIKASTVTGPLFSFPEIYKHIGERVFVCALRYIFIKMIIYCCVHCCFHLLYVGDYVISYKGSSFFYQLHSISLNKHTIIYLTRYPLVDVTLGKAFSVFKNIKTKPPIFSSSFFFLWLHFLTFN